jgi:hypothetical protein
MQDSGQERDAGRRRQALESKVAFFFFLTPRVE